MARTLGMRIGWLVAPCVAAACAWSPDGPTLAQLHDVEPDMEEVRVENSLDEAMVAYRHFLEETPESELTPEAMRRLADLKLEKEFGLLGSGEVVELPAPSATAPLTVSESRPATADDAPGPNA
jgi:hypothetical protein